MSLMKCLVMDVLRDPENRFRLNVLLQNAVNTAVMELHLQLIVQSLVKKPV